MNPEKPHETDVLEPSAPVDAYEPPQVESILTADDLAREIQYAGISVT
jgi:hypothetical protein